MANNKKKVTPAAPKVNPQDNKDNKNTKKNAVEVLQVNDLKKLSQKDSGLDANHRIDMLMGLKAYFKDDDSASDKFGAEVVDKVNYLAAIGFTTAFIQEVYYGDSKWAAVMKQSQLDNVKALAPVIGFTIDSKLLPAPDADGNITVPAAAVKLKPETKKALDKEKKIIDSKPILDPTKIETDEQLKASLTFMLCDQSVKRLYDRVTRATEFLRSAQLFATNKLDGDEKVSKLTAIKEKRTSDLLEEIRVLVGEIPFSTVGLSHFVYKKLCEYGSPIFSFCLIRNTSKDKNNTPVEDDVLAGIVRTLVNWNNEPKLNGYIKDLERAKHELDNGTKNQEYVDAVQHNVDACTKYFEQVTNCPTDFVDNLLENLKSEDSKVKKAANNTVNVIMKSYYPDFVDATLDDATKDKLMQNIQQRAGIITNLFRDPLSQDIRYSIANITEMSVEKTEESKN